VVGFRHGHESVVPDLLLAIDLLALDDSDQPRWYRATRKGRFIHQMQDIDRISVRSESLGKETEVVREGHACRKNFLQSKNLLIWVECELVSAAGWGSMMTCSRPLSS
jgi:hypothetical protein